MLINILDALALVRLGGTLLANFRCKLADLLLVGTGDNDLVGRGNLDGDTVDLGHSDLMRETDIENKLLALGFEGKISLKLDHHVPRGEQPENAVIWTHSAACGELVLALIDALVGGPDKTEADLLYIAVSTDTGCFCYANTNSATFRAAARLCDAGADLPLLNKIFFRTKSPARLALEGMVCSSLRSYRDHAINIAVITLDMLRRAGVTEDDCSDLASLAGQVRGNRVAITVRELSVDPPHSKVSLRTDGGVDASQVCARFGGGGHKMASGCELDLPPDETADAVRRAVEEVWA